MNALEMQQAGWQAILNNFKKYTAPFFKDWGLFSVEVVALNAVSYYVHLPFFISNYDLLPAFTEKIAEELISPKPPGHTLILLETAEALGLSRQEVLEQPASAAGRGPIR